MPDKNISPAEARIGWGVFYASNGLISQEELQADVDQLGIGRISDRMYRHYKALFSAGYDHYLPINRFDIIQSAEPFSDESSNARYRYSKIGEPVRIVAVRDQPFTFFAWATRVSDAGLTVQVTDSDVGQSLSKGRSRLKVGEYLRVEFLEGTQAAADGRLVDRLEKSPTDETWNLEVEFNRLRSVVEFTSGQPMETSALPLRLGASDGESVPADVLGRRLFHLLDALENVRALVNDVADREAPRFSERAYPAQITHVRMDSPLEVTVLVPLGVVGVLGMIFTIMKGLPVAFKTVQDGRLSGASARKTRAEAETIEVDNLLRRELVQHEIRRVLRTGGAKLSDDAPTSRLFNNTLEKLTENVEALAREDVTAVELPEVAQLEGGRTSLNPDGGLEASQPKDSVPKLPRENVDSPAKPGLGHGDGDAEPSEVDAEPPDTSPPALF